MPAFVFDAYGTLFDLNHLEKVVQSVVNDEQVAKRICEKWRQKQLSYAWRSVLMNRYQDFDKLTEQALLFALEDELGQFDDTLVSQFMQAHQKLPLYDDVLPTFEQLEDDHKLVILSNGTFRSLQTAADHAGILFQLDYILSVEPIRTYKPTRAAYQLALDTLHLDREEIIFVSSNNWDITGAKAFGFKSIWCNRTNKTQDPLGPFPDVEVSSLLELPQHI